MIQDIQLDEDQADFFTSYFNKVKVELEFLVEYMCANRNITNREIIYSTDNFEVRIKSVTRNDDFSSYFDSNRLAYQPVFNMNNCLINIMEKIYNNFKFTNKMTFLNYKVSPYMVNNTLYKLNIGQDIGIKFYDSASNKEI